MTPLDYQINALIDLAKSIKATSGLSDKEFDTLEEIEYGVFYRQTPFEKEILEKFEKLGLIDEVRGLKRTMELTNKGALLCWVETILNCV